MGNESHFVSKSSLSYALGRLGDVSVGGGGRSHPVLLPFCSTGSVQGGSGVAGFGFSFSVFSFVCLSDE